MKVDLNDSDLPLFSHVHRGCWLPCSGGHAPEIMSATDAVAKMRGSSIKFKFLP